ncbi:UDP-glucose 4-epimerase GalE [Oceanibacterium hippocampi]|uniref:UDP-glucose 4-epimerase n=1 Tax=Oceanibacterium hippocampi TaxID=745714 RepID=A0A1Y5TPD9_9PROT|nr:UDP-glucose 4-epimerase GalE [Oceanibacterium hippocampi]SLN68974.1 UDP-glucose 4-epimerase [Oceanibacterium hippocampi]
MKNRTVLITGGAGYIGSHAVLAFRDAGYRVAVLDNLTTGIRAMVPDGVPLIVGDVADFPLVTRTIRDHDVAAVVHFAGSVVVPESVSDPLKYYRNNTAATARLLEACVASEVGYFVFSSTAAVYGIADAVPVNEESPTGPINPYGTSKLMTELMLKDVSAAHGLTYAALRYFNVAGGDPLGRTGQSTPNATHLIKVAAEVAVGIRDHISVFGDDYDTPDGTCIRDYIHVSDLAALHVTALEDLYSRGENLLCCCGYGHGFSVRQVLEAVERVSGRKLDVRMAPRRAGDSDKLYSDPQRLRDRFGWQPRHDDLDFIVKTAIDWERRRVEGA